MPPELSRPIAIDRLPAAVTVEASAAECAALASRLQIPEVQSVLCRFTLRMRGGEVEAGGTLEAKVVQTCIISLEPLEQEVIERFSIRFVPEDRLSEDDDPDAPDEIPYHGNSIDLGEATAEQLALALDPYPRHPDAELDPAATEPDANPFASLTALHSASRKPS